MTKAILFLTGTRADFGKLKPLMSAVDAHPDFTCSIFVTGMHTLKQYGHTVHEVHKAGFQDVHVYMNQHHGDHMEMVLANTISGLSRYVHEHRPDMLVVHGDRVEALAGAIVGALSNTLVCHVEGGERSGTVDELIRHSVSKLSHLHFVANAEAKARLIQMGECENTVFEIGSPDIDVMMSSSLPSLSEALTRYEIPFSDYGVLLFHPVTTDVANMPGNAKALVDAAIESGQNYVVVYPNNDLGNEAIFAEYQRFCELSRFRVFPSIGFEYFLVLLKNARFMLGNSSAGIREAPVYGLPSINVGNRQASRYMAPSIINTPYDTAAIRDAIETVCTMGTRPKPLYAFGRGDSATRFVKALESSALWRTSPQKIFRDLPSHVTGRAPVVASGATGPVN